MKFLPISVLSKLGVSIAIVLTLLAVIPMYPYFSTGTGLDESWAFGLKDAFARKLTFGRDIVFTFGPYASIYTYQYNAVTDHLTMIGSALLASGYAAALYSIAETTTVRLKVEQKQLVGVVDMFGGEFIALEGA